MKYSLVLLMFVQSLFAAVPPRVNGVPVSSEVALLQFPGATWGGLNATGVASGSNDSTVLNTAIAQLSAAGGGTITLPPGNGMIGTTINMQANVVLRGSGHSTKLVAKTVMLPIVMVTGTNAGMQHLTIVSAETALTWDTVATNIQNRAGILITANDTTLEDVTILNSSTGVKLDAAIGLVARNVKVYNNWLSTGLSAYNNSSGILITDSANAGDVQIIGGRDEGVANGVLVGFTAQRISIIGRYALNLLDNGVYFSSSKNAEVLGCFMTNLIGSGITGRVFDGNFSGNIIDGYDVGYGISVTGIPGVPTDAGELAYTVARNMPTNYVWNGRNLVISKNIIKNGKNGGINVGTATLSSIKSYSHNLIMDGNILENTSQTNGVNAAQADPIQFSSDQANVHDNLIYGWSPISTVVGIRATSPFTNNLEMINIHHNLLVGTNVARGIQVNQVSYGSVSDNIFKGMITNAISVAGCLNMTVHKNDSTGAGIGYIGTAGNPSTNTLVTENRTGFQFQNAATQINFAAYLNDPPILNSLEFLKFDSTNQTMSVGVQASPSADPKTLWWGRLQTNGVVQEILQNDVASGNPLAGAQKTFALSGFSGLVGGFCLDNSNVKKAGFMVLENSLGNGIWLRAQSTNTTGGSMDIKMSSGFDTEGVMLSGMVWRHLGAFANHRNVQSGTYQILTNDAVVVSTATSTKTLPAANTTYSGMEIEVSSVGAAVITTVAPSGSDTINGAASSVVLGGYQTGLFRSDGSSAWVRVSAPIGYTIPFGTATFGAPAASTTYYLGADIVAPGTVYASVSVPVPKAGLLRRITIKIRVTGTLASGETVTYSVRLNDTTDISAGTATWNSATVTTTTDLTPTQVAAGDTLVVKIATPAWSPLPTNVRPWALLYIE